MELTKDIFELALKAKPVRRFNNALRVLAGEMIDYVVAGDHLGLAAPQIGKSLQLFVVRYNGDVWAMCNPKILSLWGNYIGSEEGCLSLPGEIWQVGRRSALKVRGKDTWGVTKVVTTTEAELAVIIQHEYDHLMGTLISHKGMRRQ